MPLIKLNDKKSNESFERLEAIIKMTNEKIMKTVLITSVLILMIVVSLSGIAFACDESEEHNSSSSNGMMAGVTGMAMVDSTMGWSMMGAGAGFGWLNQLLMLVALVFIIYILYKISRRIK